MGLAIKRLWAWLRRSVRPLPEEPELTKSKQVDDSRTTIGFRFWF